MWMKIVQVQWLPYIIHARLGMDHLHEQGRTTPAIGENENWFLAQPIEAEEPQPRLDVMANDEFQLIKGHDRVVSKN